MFASAIASTSLPNLHPAVLHFPIALLSIAVLTETISWMIRRRSWLEPASVALYVLGSLSALATWYTGRMAADSVGLVPWEAQEAIAAHSDLALRTVLIFSMVALGRTSLAIYRAKIDTTSFHVLRGLLLFVGIFGVHLLMETADRGGALVYKHGVAVTGTVFNNPNPDGEAAYGLTKPPLGVQVASPSESSNPIQYTDDGGLSWTPAPTDLQALGGILEVVEVSPSAQVRAVLDTTSIGGLRIESTGMLHLLLRGERGDVDLRAMLDASNFVGTIGLVHHWSSIEDFESMTLDRSSEAVLFTVEGGKTRQLDKDDHSWPNERFEFAVTAARSHLKGFVDGRTVVHGHRNADSTSGRVGLLLDGEGSIQIFRVRVAQATVHH